ncbi:hypothetical protein WJX72_009858 [[Myrmecia] bisecta]|uniref:tRNA-guanine(15) transglycosylase-like domain-containing protein n=1 Tax=[Myrmecia] bisecta TaxID=41462 RepID=A0AAW1Q4E6_9CHLO
MDWAGPGQPVGRSYGEVKTPAVLLYARRGGVLNLLPDLLDSLKPEASAIQLDATHYVAKPSPELLQQHGGGAHGFLALQDYVLVATARDPTVYTYTGRKAGSEDGVQVEMPHGSTLLTPARHMEVIASLRPDVYVSLCDEVLLEVHNTYQYLAFVKRMRESIHEGRFMEFKQAFLNRT